MKILMISNAYPPYITGGYEIACFDNVQRLRNKGHDVYILTSDYRKHEKHPADTDKKVYRRLMLEDRFYQFKPSPVFDDYHFRQKLSYLKNTPLMQYYLWKINPDILFFWNAGLLSYILILMAEYYKPTAYYISDSWLLAPPTYVSFNRHLPRDFGNRKYFIKDYRHMMRNIFFEDKTTPMQLMDVPLPQNIIFCSQALQKAYLDSGFPYQNAEIIYHGINPEIFHPINTSQKQEGKVRLLYCGRLTKFKGIETLIDALDLLINQQGKRNLRLTIVGQGENLSYPEILLEKVQKLSLEKYVDWIPGIERNKMPELYTSHDILIFPSIWPEPFSITILEAMACGIPIIGTATGGSREILEDGKNSLVFRENDPFHLAEKIGLLEDNPNLQDKLRAEGLITIKDYTLDRMTDKIEKYLLQVLKMENEMEMCG